MDRTKAASDRIRPFLEAMERSIDDVRRKRMQESGESPAPLMSPSPTPSTGESSPTGSYQPTDHPSPPTPSTGADEALDSGPDDAPPVRLKARPKRPSAFTNSPYERDGYRSQAG